MRCMMTHHAQELFSLLAASWPPATCCIFLYIATVQCTYTRRNCKECSMLCDECYERKTMCRVRVELTRDDMAHTCGDKEWMTSEWGFYCFCLFGCSCMVSNGYGALSGGLFSGWKPTRYDHNTIFLSRGGVCVCMCVNVCVIMFCIIASYYTTSSIGSIGTGVAGCVSYYLLTWPFICCIAHSDTQAANFIQLYVVYSCPNKVSILCVIIGTTIAWYCLLFDVYTYKVVCCRAGW